MEFLQSIAQLTKKYGLFPAVSFLALILGGYGCYVALSNQRTIQSQEVSIAKLESRLDSNTKELSDRMGGVEKSLVELTTQIKLLVEGRLVIGRDGQ